MLEKEHGSKRECLPGACCQTRLGRAEAVIRARCGMQEVFRRWVGLVAISLGVCLGARADGLQPEALGVRLGLSASSLNELYSQAEVLLRWRLFETRREADSGWIGMDLDWTVGALAGQGNSGLVSSLGPLLRIGAGTCPLAFEGGISPTFISKRVFDEDDFGAHLQFTSHVGFSYRLTQRTSIAYRFQHMSNANLGDSNPGLNLHALGVIVRL